MKSVVKLFIFLVLIFFNIDCKNNKDILFNLKVLKYFLKFQHHIPTECIKEMNIIVKMNFGKKVEISEVSFLTHDSQYYLSGKLMINNSGEISSSNILVIKNNNPLLECKDVDTTQYNGEIKGKLIRNFYSTHLDIQLYLNNNLYSKLKLKNL